MNCSASPTYSWLYLGDRPWNIALAPHFRVLIQCWWVFAGKNSRLSLRTFLGAAGKRCWNEFSMTGVSNPAHQLAIYDWFWCNSNLQLVAVRLETYSWLYLGNRCWTKFRVTGVGWLLAAGCQFTTGCSATPTYSWLYLYDRPWTKFRVTCVG